MLRSILSVAVLGCLSLSAAAFACDGYCGPKFNKGFQGNFRPGFAQPGLVKSGIAQPGIVQPGLVQQGQPAIGGQVAPAATVAPAIGGNPAGLVAPPAPAAPIAPPAPPAPQGPAVPPPAPAAVPEV